MDHDHYNSTGKLPQIHSNRRQLPEVTQSQHNLHTNDRDKFIDEHYTPFRLPNDEEVFVFREAERARKEDTRKVNQSLKIWDKTTSLTRMPPRNFRNQYLAESLTVSPDTVKVHQYSKHDKGVIEQAMEIIRERRKTKEDNMTNKKENIVEIVEQKKEMFLVELNVGIIKNEIDRLKLITNEKQAALEQSDRMLNIDKERFEKFYEESKQKKKIAEDQADDEIKKRKEKEIEIKTLFQRLSSIKSENLRMEEVANMYKDYKLFLDALTPKEFVENLEVEKKKMVEVLKQEYVARELPAALEDLNDEGDSKGDTKTNMGMNKLNKMKTPVVIQPTQTNKAKQLTKTLEDKFMKMIEEGRIEKIDEFEDNYDLYFKKPEQLLELFTTLEERNLFLIQMTQDAEQNLEELKNAFQQRQRELESKKRNLLENKNILANQIHAIDNDLRSLQRMTDDTRNKSKLDEAAPLKNKITEVYTMLKEEHTFVRDADTKYPLAVLRTMELRIEELLKELVKYPPDLVDHWRRECESTRNKKQREEKFAKMQEENDKKKRLAMERMRLPPKKHMGRQDMFKAIIIPKKVKKEKVETNNKESDEIHFLNDSRMKF